MGVCVRTHTQAHTRGVEEGSMRGLGRERERWRQRKREEEEDSAHLTGRRGRSLETRWGRQLWLGTVFRRHCLSELEGRIWRNRK